MVVGGDEWVSLSFVWWVVNPEGFRLVSGRWWFEGCLGCFVTLTAATEEEGLRMVASSAEIERDDEGFGDEEER